MRTGVQNENIGIVNLCVRLFPYAFRRLPGLFAVLASMLLTTGLGLLKPWPMKLIVDHVLDTQPLTGFLGRAVLMLPGGAEREALLAWGVAGLVGVFLAGWGLGVAHSLANISFGKRMVYDLAADLFGHLQKLSLRYHNRARVGDTIKRVTADSASVSTILNDTLLPSIASFVTLVMMVMIMLAMDTTLTLLSLAVVPLMIITFRLYMNPMYRRSQKEKEMEGELYNVVDQTLTSIPVVQAFGREEHEDGRFRSTTRNVLTAVLATLRVEMQFKVLMGLATAAGTAAILWFGAHRVLEGQLTIGSILVFLSYLGSMYAPLNALMYTSSTIQSAAAGARRVLEILETEQEVKDRPGALSLTSCAGNVRFENVVYGYRPGVPVLKGISLDVPAGNTVAVVGPSGAGKSTLLSLLPRFFDPSEGRVLVDGHDVRDIQLKRLRSQVSLVLQEPLLFPITIAENIAYGRPEASRDEIEQAARVAHAHQFIERLPQGYGTIVGERGATLSGGERQRVSIARALLKNAPILILDEPTSALDAETEMLLLDALKHLLKGRTTLVIAHRLSTIRMADTIVVMEKGQVVELGNHEQLMTENGLYARLHDLQVRNRPFRFTVV